MKSPPPPPPPTNISFENNSFKCTCGFSILNWIYNFWGVSFREILFVSISLLQWLRDIELKKKNVFYSIAQIISLRLLKFLEKIYILYRFHEFLLKKFTKFSNVTCIWCTSNQQESQQTNIINKMCASLLGKILLSDPNLSLSVKKIFCFPYGL